MRRGCGDAAARARRRRGGRAARRVEVARPNGSTQCAGTSATTLDCTADTTGTYTVLVSDTTRLLTGGYTIELTS